MRISLVIAAAAAALLAGAAAVVALKPWQDRPSSAAVAVGGPFHLKDQNGRPVDEGVLKGKWSAVFFGFTYCPDICPTDLQNIGLALDRLGPAGEAVQPLFVTLDPERDTAAHLADYVGLFHPRLIGLTGDGDAIRKAADAYKVFYARVPRSDGSDYTVDHSAFIYVMDRGGRYLGFFPPGTPPDRMADVIRPLVE